MKILKKLNNVEKYKERGGVQCHGVVWKKASLLVGYWFKFLLFSFCIFGLDHKQPLQGQEILLQDAKTTLNIVFELSKGIKE